MKITNIIFLSPLIGLGVALMEDHAPVSHRALKSDAWKHGYREARDLWDSGAYDCDNHNDVIQDFWPDVKKDILDECEERYNLWQKDKEDCKKGAETYVYEQVADCTDLDDCKALGNLVAEDIVGSFCDTDSAYSRGYSFFPPACVDKAKKECKSLIYDLVDAKIEANKCGDLTDIMDLDTEKLDKECDKKVKDKAKKAELP